MNMLKVYIYKCYINMYVKKYIKKEKVIGQHPTLALGWITWSIFSKGNLITGKKSYGGTNVKYMLL